ncbi:ribosome biogenesis GTPase YqeH [Alicyclobacillus macrosporangiidus]|uniref:Uncharacterized protein n=1 Tax=Alicyclobacillus macrosporangiidus TaxID=392015 RepID=A0A1I7K9I5_9BACL|nr:ribosome biogenesis GTPase YqeH [Alicyclobacillus macrosporangiidus]SFU94052.1 hypothetical protein SAMN05421543_11484 [Alicyclobacillus macrosporangiidus]
MAEGSVVICAGCGAPLQSEMPEAPGYVPASAFDRDKPVCRRCFRIRHYGEFVPVAVSPDAYRQAVAGIARHPGLVLYVLDVFDLSGSMVPGLAELVGTSPVWAVVNKVDLLPAEVRPDALARWVRRLVEERGVRCDGVWFVSGRTGFGMDSLLSALDERREDRVYAVGMANVGKSTLLNRLIRAGRAEPVLTESRMPGTTLGVVEMAGTLPSGRAVSFVDTPGLMHGGRVIDRLCADCLKRAVPSARLRPRVYQLNPRQTLWIAGFARFDFVAGERQPIVVWVSNDLVVHRTKLERADTIGEERYEEVLQVPCPDCRARLGELRPLVVGAGRHRGGGRTRMDVPVPRQGCDVVLAGLGWITLFGRDLAGRLFVPEGIQVTVRERMIGGVTRQAVRRHPNA